MSDRDRRAHAGSSSFGLCLSPKELGMENLTVKGIIYFLSLLDVSMWLLAHAGKLEGVVEKLVLLLMFFAFRWVCFCGEEGQKTAFSVFL